MDWIAEYKDPSSFPESVRTPTQAWNQFRTKLGNGGLQAREPNANLNYFQFSPLAAMR